MKDMQTPEREEPTAQANGRLGSALPAKRRKTHFESFSQPKQSSKSRDTSTGVPNTLQFHNEEVNKMMQEANHQTQGLLAQQQQAKMEGRPEAVHRLQLQAAHAQGTTSPIDIQTQHMKPSPQIAVTDEKAIAMITCPISSGARGLQSVRIDDVDDVVEDETSGDEASRGESSGRSMSPPTDGQQSPPNGSPGSHQYGSARAARQRLHLRQAKSYVFNGAAR